MIRSQCLLPDRHGFTRVGLAFGIAFAGVFEAAEVVIERGGLRVDRPECLLHNRQRAMIEWLGLVVAARILIEHAKVVEHR